MSRSLLRAIRDLRPGAPRARAKRAAHRAGSRRSADRMKLVLDVSRLLAVTDLPTLLQHIAGACASLLDAERARVFLAERGGAGLWSPASGDAPEVRVAAGAGVLGHVFQTGRVSALEGLKPEPAAGEDADRGVGHGTRNLACAPLRDLDCATLGVVEVANKRGGRPFTADDLVSLELVAEHAAVAIQRFRLLQAANEGSGLRQEMEVAQRVQAALLPASPPYVPGLEATGWTRPASITGGDSYDLWTLPQGRLAVFLGDASGHGLAATLVVSQVRTMFRALSEVHADPDWLFSRVNARLAQDLDEGRFVTALFASLSAAGDLAWSSAGQGPVFVRTEPGARFAALQAPAPPLGVGPDLAGDPAPAARLEMGGMLVAMTDGIFEATSPGGELFGAARVAELLEDLGDASPAGVVDRVVDAVTRWQGSEVPVDDQTIVVARRVPVREIPRGD